MKKVLRLSPAVSTMNMGDQIIFESINRHLSSFLKDSYVVDVSTHLPISKIYGSIYSKFDYKFVCGSNLLSGNLIGPFRSWDITWVSSGLLYPVVLVGAGWWQYKSELNMYTKYLYKRILSRDFLHSVRDKYTYIRLRNAGFSNVLNTACPSMWDLTPEFCDEIPVNKEESVITTVSDYNKDPEKDKALLEILCQKYKKVYIWMQGVGDYEYIKDLGFEQRLVIVPPALCEFDKVLSMQGIEYVGIRLHGGIRALQHKKRTLIIGIDNRAKEKSADTGLPVLFRENMESLPTYIEQRRATKIEVPALAIQQWKRQFSC